MAIDRIVVKDFLMFTGPEFDARFIDGINVFIGANATGKSTLLKYIYSECEKRTDHTPNDKPVFIPTAEMLSHSNGLLAMSSKYGIPFDQTQIDILVNAQLWETKEISERNKKLLGMIGRAIGGDVLYENDTFYIQKTNGLKVEFSVEAEGFIKLGLLWKLIRNGLLESSSILLWDEPEASINPELIPLLVDVLYILKNDGVQIFLATHDYMLAKYIDLKKQNPDDVQFISLYKNDTGGIDSSTAKTYAELAHNPIENSEENLYNAIVKKASEG